MVYKRSNKYRVYHGHKHDHRHKRSGRKNKRRGDGKKTAIIILCAITAASLLFAGLMAYDRDGVLQFIGTTSSIIEPSSAPESAPTETEPMPESAETEPSPSKDETQVQLEKRNTNPPNAKDAVEQTDTKQSGTADTEIVGADADTHDTKQAFQEPSLQERIAEAKGVMFDIINAERTKAGLKPVLFGNNSAAQIHAENMLAGCSSSHWGLDGLKPYMRHTLAGGDQYNAENMHGRNYCIGKSYMTSTPDADAREAMDGLMRSQGHRDNILDPHHASVNIGIASDWRNVAIVQHFEYEDIFEFHTKPTIDEDGMFVFSATTTIPVTIESMILTYDPVPHNLTQGQVARTYCYSGGEGVAMIVPPPEPGWRYDRFGTFSTSSGCPDPYSIPPDTPAPKSHDEALSLHAQAKDAASKGQGMTEYKIPIISASEWKSSDGTGFNVKADLGDIADDPGVYTVTIYKKHGDTPAVSYSIFHKMERPDGYD